MLGHIGQALRAEEIDQRPQSGTKILDRSVHVDLYRNRHARGDFADQDADRPTAQRRGEQAEGQLLEIRHRAGELAADIAGGVAVEPGQQLVHLLQLLPGTARSRAASAWRSSSATASRRLRDSRT